MVLPEDLRKFESLVAITKKLRGPGGCPWDREQNHASMRENLLEECYEVLEAIDDTDYQKLKAELGDLLMQVVFHAEIATEAGEFKLGDIIEDINKKLIRRHPHVFGETEVSGTGEVLKKWEEIKKTERGEGKSLLANVPRKMPALAYSQEIQARVARVGFDWDEDEGVIDKLVEEVDELSKAGDDKEKAAEFGDILFTLANVARRQGIDLESALRQASGRFCRRFAYMEELCRQRGLELSKLSFDQQNRLWEEAKKGAE